MIILYIHTSDFFFKVKEKAVERAEEPVPETLELKNVLVAYTTIEKGDNEEVVKRASEDIIKVFNEVKASAVVVYPYAHLSSNLATPETAIKLLNELYQEIKSKGINAYKTPFGWYKEFSIHCLGHPLSELSRRIRVEELEEYQKSEEMEVCNKFGFPHSPHSLFIKNAVIEYLKYKLKPITVFEGPVDDLPENSMEILYSEPKGRRVPCINDSVRIQLRYRIGGGGEERVNINDIFTDIPNEFKDSKNTLKIYWQESGGSGKGYIYVNVNNLVYYYLLEASKKNPPTLPLWMNPVHIRILPVKKDFLDYAIRVANELKDLRVEVDDLDDGLGNKIRRAGKEWIPYVAVVGEREAKTNSLSVRIREKNEQRSFTIDEIRREIAEGDPLLLKPILPTFLSKRPKLEYL
ncbi:MAG: His/Gly/Thr/Pro-type tRNA ligase C-terminal domain-containing protein [Sulfolobaceae archaeon]|nr:His/Gly/Thr/Pro-type tRNA ligase C-terminal domain-containing protein [Sulfolobaceae archaeon]